MINLIKLDPRQRNTLANCHTDKQVNELFEQVIEPAKQAAMVKLANMDLDNLTYKATLLQGAIQFADELRLAMKKAREGV